MRSKRLLVFIGVLSLALLLAACGGDNDDDENITPTADTSSQIVPTDEPTEVAVVDESTPEITPEMEMTDETTPVMEMTEDMTPEATMEMDVTPEVTMEQMAEGTDEAEMMMTAEATEDMGMMGEMTAEATEDMGIMDEMTPEATMDMEATAEMTAEADMEPSFTIEVTGASNVSFTEADGSFEYDYEEPNTSIGTDNTAMPNSGIYTFTFSYTNTDDVENIVFVTFSDDFGEGTYVTPDELSTPETTGDALIPLIVGSVNIGEDIAYTTVLDGTITLDQFADELASGSFEFHLANTDNLDDTVTLTGEFHNLDVVTSPIDAVDAPANND